MMRFSTRALLHARVIACEALCRRSSVYAASSRSLSAGAEASTSAAREARARAPAAGRAPADAPASGPESASALSNGVRGGAESEVGYGMTVGALMERLRAIERAVAREVERDGGWFSMASVKRKRKKAMNKHKHRKRRRRDRHSNK